MPTIPHTFATYPAGNFPAADWDANWGFVAALTNIFCTVTGTANAITLTPASTSPAVTAYQDGMKFTFVATANNSGATTIAVAALPARTVFDAAGATIGAGAILTGTYYEAVFSVALNGFRLSSSNTAILHPARIVFNSAPVYDLAFGALATDILHDPGAVTIGPSKVLHFDRVSQSTGDNINVTIGINAQVAGESVFLRSTSGSDASAVLYGMVPNLTMAGPGTGKALHAAVFAEGTSAATIVAGSFGMTPVSTTPVCWGVNAALVSNAGVHDKAIGVMINSTGDRLKYGVGTDAVAVGPVPIGDAFYSAWMATASSANARAFQVRNNAGTEVGYWHKDGSAAFTTVASPITNDGAALGTTALMWSDLFLASGGVINWNSGDVTITHASNSLAFGGASSGYSFDASLLLASGTALNWNSGDVTITHASNALAFAGASNGYSFDASLLLASGTALNWNSGDVVVTHSSNALAFTGASNGYSFDALLDISNAAAGQVKFPATQNASSDVNTLDDYEEGTFTPVLAFGGGSTGITYSTQTGKYTKIGNVVFGWINIILTNKGSSTGQATVTGLPFTSADTAVTTFQGNNFAAGTVSALTASITSGTTAVTLARYSAGVGSGLSETDFNNNSVVRLTFTYPV